MAGLAPPYDPGLSDVSLRVALAHAQQGLSVVMHLESIREAVQTALTGSMTPIRRWLQYADHDMAPLRRSVTSLF